jgi:murein endopeptidase
MKKALLFVFLTSVFLSGCGQGFQIPVAQLVDADEGEAGDGDVAGLVEKKDEPAPAPSRYEKISNDFVRIKLAQPVSERLRFTKDTEENDEPEFIRRIKGALQFKELKYEFDAAKKQMLVKGEILFEQNSMPFVMSGILGQGAKNKNQVRLSVTEGSDALKKSFKALAECVSDACDEFRIDFQYFVPQVGAIYEEQFFTEKLLFGENAPVTPMKEISRPGSEEVPPLPETNTEAPVETRVETQTETDEADVPQAFVSAPDEDIIENFPELQEEKKKVEAAVKKRREAKGKPAAPTPRPAPAPVSPAPPVEIPEIKPLWPDTQAYSDDVNRLLAPLEEGVNQARGRPNGGKLVGGIDLRPLLEQLGSFAGFRIMQPKRGITFGTSELVSLIVKVGQWVQRHVPGFTLDVRNMAAHGGGKLGDQGSHQTGIDADIGYIFEETNPTSQMQKASADKGRVKEDFDVEKQWELFKALIHSEKVEFIIVSKSVKKAICEHAKETDLVKVETTAFAKKVLSLITSRLDKKEVHDTHFHMRIKCGPRQRFCSTLGIIPDPCP